MTAEWHTIPGRHWYRWTARREKRRLENLQLEAGTRVSVGLELRELGVDPSAELRVGPRWKGAWRIEQLV